MDIKLTRVVTGSLGRLQAEGVTEKGKAFMMLHWKISKLVFDSSRRLLFDDWCTRKGDNLVVRFIP